MKDLKDKASDLFYRFEDPYSSRNILFLGNLFQIDGQSEKLLNLKWNTIYTSINDDQKLNELQEKIKNKMRKCNIIETDAFDRSNDRARLIDGKALVDVNDLKIVKLFDKNTTRSAQSTAMKTLRYIEEFLKTDGILFCIGYDEKDNFNPEYFLNAFEDITNEEKCNEYPECIYIFNAKDSFEISTLGDEKLKNPIFCSETLYELWEEYICENDDVWDEEFEEPTDNDDLQIFINNKSTFIPREEVREIAPFAELLDYNSLYRFNISMPYRNWFSSFLKNSANVPKWYGYKYQFNITRQYEYVLEKIVNQSLQKTGELKYRPILLCGQSGSGKTIALGNLAYKIFIEKKYPVIYITNPEVSFSSDSASSENGNNNFDAIRRFLRYLANEKGANSILVIWDCSGLDKERRNYLKFYNKLRIEDGLNIVLVGTSYVFNHKHLIEENGLEEKTKISQFYDISTDVVPNKDEIIQLQAILKKKAGLPKDEIKIIVDTLNKGIKNGNDYASSFLAMLYYVFWEIREDLSRGVRREFSSIIKHITYPKETPFLGNLVSSNFEIFKDKLNNLNIEDSTKKKIDRFSIYIALFTYYNKGISADLMYNLLDIKNDFDSISKVLQVPMFVSHEFGYEVKYRVRTRLEAEMLLNTYGLKVNDYEKILNYFLEMLYQIEIDEFGTASMYELIGLLTTIISIIGPNGDMNLKWENERFYRLVPCFIEGLELARNATLNDPRLIVQELTLSREYYKYVENNQNFAVMDYSQFKKIFSDIRKSNDQISNYIDEKEYKSWPQKLIDKINLFQDYEKEQQDGLDVYRKQIKIERANFLLTVGLIKDDNNYIKNAAELGKIIITENTDNNYAMVIYLKANNSLLERKSAPEPEKLLSELMTFASSAIQTNPQLADDSYFSRECEKIFGGETAVKFAENIGKKNPTPAMICCHIYAKCWKKGIIYRDKDSKKIKWSSIKNDEIKQQIVNEIFNELSGYKIANDSNCLQLQLYLYWLKNNEFPFNFTEEKQHTFMSEDEWKEIKDICEKIIDSNSKRKNFNSVFCNYIKALACAQIGDYSGCKSIMLKEVKENIRNVITRHLICEKDGTPRQFSGKVIETNTNKKSSGTMDVIYMNRPAIKKVYFNKSSFFNRTATITNGESVDRIILGLNSMGLIALGNS